MGIRHYINKKYIEANPAILEEMQYHNQVYGRYESVVKRALLSLRLFLKYTINKSSFCEEREKKLAKMHFPESADNQKKQLELIGEKAKAAESIVMDIDGVLLNKALTKKQIMAFAEAELHYIGLSDVSDAQEQMDKQDRTHLAEIQKDFTQYNPAIEAMIEEWHRAGKDLYFLRADSMELTNMAKERYSSIPILDKIPDDKQQLIHITNNCSHESDIEYRNITDIGEKYRPFLYKNAVTALYTNLVNMRFHSKAEAEPLFYEYGFICGGILTCGFCQYLDRLARQEGIDKFLFVARDGDIMKQIYEKYFHHVNADYLKFSRFASYELIFEDFPEEYIDKNIKPRSNRKNVDNSIKKILSECGLEFLEKYLEEAGFQTDTVLTTTNYSQFRKFILHHKDEIVMQFSETCRAAEQYFMDAISGNKKVCIVDLGWHGKSIVYLKYLCEKKYHWLGQITGVMVGASDSTVAQNYIRKGIIHTYAFENEYWRGMGARNGKKMAYKECICLEGLFSSPTDTLLRYTFNKRGMPDFIYGKKNENVHVINQIHQGIRDFSEQFMPVIKKYNLVITARDAYTPIDAAMHNQNYVDMLYKRYDEVPEAINGF